MSCCKTDEHAVARATAADSPGSVSAPASTPTGPRIWLLARNWPARALVRAQLREEGFDVTAMEDWETLEALLREEVMAPHLVIAELTGDEPPEALALLYSFPAPRLVLRSARAPAVETLRAAGIEGVLSRPFTVGDVVNAARALLCCQTDA